MSPNPNSFLDHLREKFYHPRSDRHSNALSEAIVQDLIPQCRGIREKASRGEIVYDLNFDLIVARAVWNIDLVLGHPGPAVGAPPADQNILRRRPSTVEIAIEIKSVMTEHRKAVKNRRRDLEAHHEHVHNYNNLAIAGGVFVINASRTFRSPLRPGITMHRNPPDQGLARLVLVLDYGAAEAPEVLISLIFDQVLGEPKLFTTYIPQIGDGPVGESKLTTTLIITNLSNVPTKGTLFFHDSAGGELAITLKQMFLDRLICCTAQLPFELGPLTSGIIKTSGSGDAVRLLSGYARIVPDTPIQAAVLFSTTGPGGQSPTYPIYHVAKSGSADLM